VTDRESILKFQAEFPQLKLNVGPNPHVASHRSHAGARRDFDWGAVPAAAEANDAAAWGPISMAAEAAGAASTATPAPTTFWDTVPAADDATHEVVLPSAAEATDTAATATPALASLPDPEPCGSERGLDRDFAFGLDRDLEPDSDQRGSSSTLESESTSTKNATAKANVEGGRSSIVNAPAAKRRSEAPAPNEAGPGESRFCWGVAPGAGVS
jgi:hypothetical protein